MNYSKLLNQIITSANEEISGISTSELNIKASLEKWSKKEILGHLVDSAYNNHRRFVVTNEQDQYIFEGYNPDVWVVKNDYQNRSISEILDLWTLLNKNMAILIDGISEKRLQQKFTNHNFHKICMNLLTENEPTSMAYLIWDYLFHIEHHLVQIIPSYKRQVELIYKN